MPTPNLIYPRELTQVSIAHDSNDHIDTVVHKVYSAFLRQNHIEKAPPYYAFSWSLTAKEWYTYLGSSVNENNKDYIEIYLLIPDTILKERTIMYRTFNTFTN